MSNINIIKAGPDDVKTLQTISRSTFVETYAASNSEANMKAYLEKDFSLEQLAKELQDENAEFYFAELEGNIIGYLKLNSGASQTELKDANSLEIERIYVLKAYHGKKAGQLFYEKAVQVATERKMDYVWLGVWEQNPRAISFYKKNGFVEFDKHIFRLGDDEQIDIMMKLVL